MGKEKILDYVELYQEYVRKIDYCINYAEGYLRRIDEHAPQLRISKIKIENKLFTFSILDFDIEIRFSINVSKDKGYLKWYLIRFNPEKREKEGILLSRDSFDHQGNVDQEINITSASYWLPCIEKMLNNIEGKDINLI